MAFYGYARCSTNKQDVDNQRMAILNYANENNLGRVDYIAETISSKSKDRLIFELIEKLRHSDTLIVFELSRLARSMAELDSMRVKIAERGATIRVISQNLILSPDSNDIQTMAIVFALSLSAQIERTMISERTKNALAAKKVAGVILGRPRGVSRLDSSRDHIRGYFSKGLNVTAVAKLVDCNRQTLANWLKRPE